uniref:Uncharacterized protein n=1 Tax=Rhizophora mucronata TaxID=61149 RepID=A0A2P2N048_RHIMU
MGLTFTLEGEKEGL